VDGPDSDVLGGPLVALCVFEEYDLPGLKTVNGVVDMSTMGKGAWFKDSEGDALGISQM